MVQVSVSLNRAGWSSHTGKPRRIQTCKARAVGRQEKNGSTLAFKLKEADGEAGSQVNIGSRQNESQLARKFRWSGQGRNSKVGG